MKEIKEEGTIVYVKNRRFICDIPGCTYETIDSHDAQEHEQEHISSIKMVEDYELHFFSSEEQMNKWLELEKQHREIAKGLFYGTQWYIAQDTSEYYRGNEYYGIELKPVYQIKNDLENDVKEIEKKIDMLKPFAMR